MLEVADKWRSRLWRVCRGCLHGFAVLLHGCGIAAIEIREVFHPKPSVRIAPDCIFEPAFGVFRMCFIYRHEGGFLLMSVGDVVLFEATGVAGCCNSQGKGGRSRGARDR